MSLIHGPNIINSGLVLALDADNSKSYPGEPTTNLLPQPLSFETGYTKESWSGTITDNYSGVVAPDGTNTATLINYTGGYFYKRNTTSPTFTISEGDTFTFSCWVLALDSTNQTGNGLRIRNYDFNANRGISSQTISQSAWTRCSVTYTAIAGESSFGFTFSGGDANDFQGAIAIWHPQVEKIGHATPFVDGIRSATDGWKDLSGNEYHGDLTNMTYDTNAEFDFDGSSADVSFDAQYIIGASSGTIGAWIYLDGSQTNHATIFTCQVGPAWADMRLTFNIYTPNKVRLHVSDGVSPIQSNCVSSALNYTQWYYVVGTYDGIAAKIYINGSLDKTYNTSVVPGTFTPATTKIGYMDYSTRYFDGQIDRLQIYNRSLTAAEILQNYNAMKQRFI